MDIAKKNNWLSISKEEKETIFIFNEKYKSFLDLGKTEREVIVESIKEAKKYGFKDINSFEKLQPGDKVFYINRHKNIILAVIGKDSILDGVNFIVSHIDSPRLDLKQNPLYEDLEFALMKTHYYGGIKKYQWVSTPLALHGTVILKNGNKINISIGEEKNDPIFVIPDILPHLDANIQRNRKANEVFKGEELNILVGSIPTVVTNNQVKDSIKKNILEILKSKFNINEDDFISAELQLVPAHKARDIGFDHSLVGSYGQDDRICAFTSLQAICNINSIPKRTAICFLADKEEIGSTGSTGLQSFYIEYVLADIISKVLVQQNYNDLMLRKCLWNSKALSADVNAGVNPIFKSVHDIQNASKLGYGIVVTKYTGSRGKSNTNDADAEYVAEIRKLLDDNNIKWQTGMLGKVDEGGGGTVAMFLAHHGISTIDAGPALLSMHSPLEISSKFDVYETYKAYKAFFEIK